MLIASPTCATYRLVALIESKLKNKKKFKYCKDLGAGIIKIALFIISTKYFQLKVMLYIFSLFFLNLYLVFYLTRYCVGAQALCQCYTSDFNEYGVFF